MGIPSCMDWQSLWIALVTDGKNNLKLEIGKHYVFNVCKHFLVFQVLKILVTTVWDNIDSV